MLTATMIAELGWRNNTFVFKTDALFNKKNPFQKVKRIQYEILWSYNSNDNVTEAVL